MRLQEFLGGFFSNKTKLKYFRPPHFHLMSSPVCSSLNVYIFVHFSPTLVQTKTPFNDANIYRKFRLLLFVTEFSSVYTKKSFVESTFSSTFWVYFWSVKKKCIKKVISVSYGTMWLALMRGNLLHNNENPIHEMFEGEKSRERFQWTPF